MNDIISRNIAIKAIADLPNCYNGFSDTFDKACIIGVLEELAPIDAVQVVRCKDCKYWYAGENINYCRKFWDDDGEPKLYRCTADDFCSRAERKEE